MLLAEPLQWLNDLLVRAPQLTTQHIRISTQPTYNTCKGQVKLEQPRQIIAPSIPSGQPTLEGLNVYYCFCIYNACHTLAWRVLFYCTDT